MKKKLKKLRTKFTKIAKTQISEAIKLISYYVKFMCFHLNFYIY